MLNTSANAHYWSAVIDVLSCIYNYKSADDDGEEYTIRYEEYVDAVASARDAYIYCGRSLLVPFGMTSEYDLESFFSLLLLNPQYLDDCYNRALENYSNESAAVPLRSL